MAMIALMTAILFALTTLGESAILGKDFGALGKAFPTAKKFLEDVKKDVKNENNEIHGYHFHTYFYQAISKQMTEAYALRSAIQEQIDNGFLANCRLNRVHTDPFGPHVVANYETCCNSTSISPAISFFMQNYGNLTVLLHPLTRWQLKDHTDRIMYLGKPIPLHPDNLREDLGDNTDLCLPINN